ncbi:MAG: FAD binding domain-containing protein [Enterocloster asparagiformis]|nr:FAD binding domain-containing protein [Enterocloster asparagiformis]
MSVSKMIQPETLEEALRALSGERAMACAGATNLYVDRRHGKYLDRDYVSLDRLPQLRQIRREDDGWHIGSMASFSQLERCEIPFAGALAQSASMVGGPQIRNRGTVGGNIVSASPAADSVPPLMALDARLRLVKDGGQEREIPLRDFMTGPGRTDLEHGELLTEVILPEKSGKSIFYKAGKRNALAISLCSCAVYLNVRDGVISEAAVALGSVAPTAVRAVLAEAVLAGSALEDLRDGAFKERLRAALMEDIAPIDDIRATAEYRRRIALRMLLHNTVELWRCFQ